MKSVIALILCDILFFFISLFDLQMFQQNGYNNKNRYLKFLLNFLKRNYIWTILRVVLIALMFIIPTTSKLLFLFVLLYIIVLIIQSIMNYISHNTKLPLKFTSRVIRTISIDYLLYIIVQIVSFTKNYNIIVLALMSFILLHPFILLFVNLLLQPVEKHIFNKYKKQAISKLNRMPDLRIIGITGSYGKTSTKLVLNSVLSAKYKGFCTPGSFNTPNGNIMTINAENDIFNEYFISEMGAKKEGEIKEICDIVHPKYAIITKIGEAHLEFFKSIENICNTKFELVESLGKDGVAILNKDDPYQKNYKIKNKCNVIWIGIKTSADVMAKNIKITNEGTTFDVYFAKEDHSVTVSTVLLGQKNVYNILAACALGHYFGLSDKELVLGVKRIAPISHRLEVRNVQNTTIIDDSYNSNPEGSKTALEVLSLMEGCKYIITPGMIELGEKQYELNKEFGKEIAKVCDKVYLIGKNQTKPIQDGLTDAKYSFDNVKIFNQFKEAYNDIIKTSGNKKSVILIENDLPDSFTEGK